MSDKRVAEILLIEDNLGDIRLAQELFKEGKKGRIKVVTDGTEALTYLRQAGKYAHTRLPDLILLDLNLPKKDGHEVLAEIKRDPALRWIPVIVLSTSEAEKDVVRAYNSHANCYIVKPLDLAEFTRIVQLIEDFWLSVVQLPRGDSNETRRD